jgi:hypothetical protein
MMMMMMMMVPMPPPPPIPLLMLPPPLLVRCHQQTSPSSSHALCWMYTQVPWGLTPMLARDIGLPKAKELIMLCDAIEAQEALTLGLINKVASSLEELDELVRH